MKLIVRKESWKRFALKAAIVLALLWVAGTSFAGRYRIGYDPQLERCLPNHSVYLIDLKDKELHRDAIYAFSA
ncbi:S26 family signal peptidase, partial [Vibrio parahaemolyticus]|nr:S26 family signal peptidase [Vibrio parahaemolyticus]